MKKNIKVIVDTNLWISWLITKRQSRLNLLLSDSSISIISSTEQTEELFEVIKRSKFSKLIPSEIAEEFKIYFIQAVELHKVKLKVKASRDEKDDFLLALAKTANANFLITGDKDLLVIKNFWNTKIITLTDYMEK